QAVYGRNPGAICTSIHPGTWRHRWPSRIPSICSTKHVRRWTMAHPDDSQSTQELFLELLKYLGFIGLHQLDNERSAESDPYSDPFVSQERAFVFEREELQNLGSDGNVLVTRGKCVVLPRVHEDNSFWVPFLWIQELGTTNVSIQMVLVGKARRFGF